MANIFNTNKLDSLFCDEKYKGCTNVELDEMLELVAPELKTVNFFCSNPFFPKPTLDYVWQIINTPIANKRHFKIDVVVYLLSVRLIESVWHQTAVLSVNNELFYSDPYRQSMVKLLSKEDLGNNFIDCCEITGFRLHEENTFAILNGEAIGYKLTAT